MKWVRNVSIRHMLEGESVLFVYIMADVETKN